MFGTVDHKSSTEKTMNNGRSSRALHSRLEMSPRQQAYSLRRLRSLHLGISYKATENQDLLKDQAPKGDAASSIRQHSSANSEVDDWEQGHRREVSACPESQPADDNNQGRALPHRAKHFSHQDNSFENRKPAIPQGHDLFKLTPAEKRDLYQHLDLNRLGRRSDVVDSKYFHTALCNFYNPKDLPPILGMNFRTFEACCIEGNLEPKPMNQFNRDSSRLWSFLVTIIYPGEFRPSFVQPYSSLQQYEDMRQRTRKCRHELFDLELKRCKKNLDDRLTTFVDLFYRMSPLVGSVTISCWIPLIEWAPYIENVIIIMRDFARHATDSRIKWNVRFDH